MNSRSRLLEGKLNLIYGAAYTLLAQLAGNPTSKRAPQDHHIPDPLKLLFRMVGYRWGCRFVVTNIEQASTTRGTKNFSFDIHTFSLPCNQEGILSDVLPNF